MKSLFIVPALFAALLVPSFVQAQTPAPISKAIGALESDSYRTKVTSSFKMGFLGATLTTDTKADAYTDAAGNAEGKVKMKMSFSSENSKKSGDSFSMPMQYKYFAEDDSFYLKFDKLPKGESPIKGVKAKTWYKGTITDSEMLTRATNQAYLTSEHFLEAQAKHPAIKFVEVGSTKKEYRYAYSVDQSRIASFLMEQARLSGATMTQIEAGQAASFLGAVSGTLSVDKKTLQPTKQTQRVGASDGLNVQTTATYSFKDSKKITRPKKAVADPEVIEALFPGT
jgi:hypothetical protein